LQQSLLGSSPALKRNHSDSLDSDGFQVLEEDENKENVSVAFCCSVGGGTEDPSNSRCGGKGFFYSLLLSGSDITKFCIACCRGTKRIGAAALIIATANRLEVNKNFIIVALPSRC